MEPQTLVSALVFPDTLPRLNFDTLDPSDAMKNFKHTMSFTKTHGFKPVNPVEHIASSTMSDSSPAVTIGPSNTTLETPNSLDQQIIQIYREQGAIHATKFYKDQTGSDLKTTKEYVDRLIAVHGIK